MQKPLYWLDVGKDIEILLSHITLLESQVPRLELAFKNQKFPGIVANNHFIEEGEVIDYIKKLESQKGELEKIISDGVLKDHNGCQIYCDEEYTKLESKFYTAEEKIKELEKAYAIEKSISMAAIENSQKFDKLLAKASAKTKELENLNSATEEERHRISKLLIEARVRIVDLTEGIEKAIEYLMKWGVFGNEQECGMILNKLYKLVEEK